MKGGRRLIFVAATVVLAVLCVAEAAAQTVGALRPRRVTASVGAGLLGGYPIGSVDGNLRRNTAGTPSPFTLLHAESEIERARTVEARVAVALSRAFEVELGGLYATPQLTVNISRDAEHDGGVTASEALAHYGVEISGVYLIPGPAGWRLRPYVIGGGGYLRQLHEGRLRLETGSTVHAGGGLRYWIVGGRTGRLAVGARAEARYVRRNAGIDFEDASRTFPSLSLLALIGF